MKDFSTLQEHLLSKKYRWIVTGAAGFIGNNLCRRLLEMNQDVIGIDNFSTGLRLNIDEIEMIFSKTGRWHFFEKDICDYQSVLPIAVGTNFILHQAALGSVPRSIKDPLASHRSNVDGQIKILEVARQTQVQKIVYASSSSVYGDHPDLPKREGRVGQPLSPYAATKKINEIYGTVFHKVYNLPTVGLRYFNVFGPRQNPKGPYAAVIPLWIEDLLNNKPVFINGDGTNSRDFCYIENVVQANLLAALSGEVSNGKIYNIAFGGRTDLNTLYQLILDTLKEKIPGFKGAPAVHRENRPGDIAHSHADIGAAQRDLVYNPEFSARAGLQLTIEYFINNRSRFSISEVK